MDTRVATSNYRLSQWARRIRDQQVSGQKVGQWCEANGVKRHQFFYWQRKLREAAVNGLSATEPMPSAAPSGWAVMSSDSLPSHSAPADNKALKPAGWASKGLTIEIGDYRILTDGEFDPEELKRICLVLESISRAQTGKPC